VKDATSRHIHLVDSVPLANAIEVFAPVSAALGRTFCACPMAASAATGLRIWNEIRKSCSVREIE
jgi:hypothetical protein